MSYKLNELKQLVHEAKREQGWTNFLTRIRESFLLESPSFLKEASILKNKYPFKAIFVFGPAGAGKSFLSKQIGIPKDFKVANPDERIEAVFPAFGISMKFVGREQAKQSDALGKEYEIQQMSRNIMSNATSGHTANLLMIANPLVFDTTGEAPKKMMGRIENLMRLGYDVGVFQVNVPTEVSVQRDKDRERVVGEPTEIISKEYQEFVVRGKAYLNAAESLPHMHIFGGDIYPNLYDLRNGELLPGITQELVDQVNPGFTSDDAKAILGQAKSDVQSFLTAEPMNPTGKMMLKAMKAMVKITGKYGQNMNDLSFAGKVVEEFPEIKDSPEIMAGIKAIENLAGESNTIQDAITTGHLKALKGIKDTGDNTVRDMTGGDVGNRNKLFAVKQKQKIAAIRADDSLSDEAKKKAIDKIANKKKFEERLSKTAIYNIVKNAIDN